MVEIEFTDEFERWWETLDAETQDSIAVKVRLLEEEGTNLGSLTVQISKALVTDVCENFGYNIKRSLTGFCMPSIPGGLRYSF